MAMPSSWASAMPELCPGSAGGFERDAEISVRHLVEAYGVQCPSLPLVQDYGFSYGQEVGYAYVGFGLQRVAVFRVRQMVDVEREFASLSLRLVEAWGDEPFGVLGYAVLVEGRHSAVSVGGSHVLVGIHGRLLMEAGPCVLVVVACLDCGPGGC